MAENTAYFDSITATRSMRVKDPFDTAFQTISLETQPDLAKDSVALSIQDNFGRFLPFLRMLNVEDQELGFAYFLLGKPQWALAKLYKSTQTQCSYKIRMAMKKLGVLMTYNGHPTEEDLDLILEEHGVNDITPIRSSRLVVEYRTRRSFASVADTLKLHRPDVRRALNKAATTLLNDEHPEHVALGAYIHGLIDKASISGTGLSDRKMAKHVHMHKTDPLCVGVSLTNVEDPGFASVLVSKASVS